MTSFADLGVPAVLTKTLDKLGITTPTPIQAATLPDSLGGRDVLGRGRTGSGKTFAFLLPLVARLDETRYETRTYKPRSLVLAPTRELAIQIQKDAAGLSANTDIRITVCYGGAGYESQRQELTEGVDLLIGGTNSGASLAMAKVAAEKKKPFISIGAGSARLSRELAYLERPAVSALCRWAWHRPPAASAQL
mgnify:CR=1 FL=1